MLQAPWRVTDTAAAAGAYGYRAGADGGPYPDRTCGSLNTPPLTLTADAVLSLQARYDLEYQRDGASSLRGRSRIDFANRWPRRMHGCSTQRYTRAATATVSTTTIAR